MDRHVCSTFTLSLYFSKDSPLVDIVCFAVEVHSMGVGYRELDGISPSNCQDYNTVKLKTKYNFSLLVCCYYIVVYLLTPCSVIVHHNFCFQVLGAIV